jgi:hypothetical protein
VDVEAIMMDLERKSGHKSNWRTSIVDLMSLLGMENSLAERKELAKELGYTGDMNDSATMNIWLHKQVMQQMAANAGTCSTDRPSRSARRRDEATVAPSARSWTAVELGVPRLGSTRPPEERQAISSGPARRFARPSRPQPHLRVPIGPIAGDR